MLYVLAVPYISLACSWQHAHDLADEPRAAQVWREVSGQVFFAVLTFQLVMVALLALKQAPIVALLAAPLPILTVALWRSAEVLFGPPQEVLSLEAAADLDRRDQVRQHFLPRCT